MKPFILCVACALHLAACAAQPQADASDNATPHPLTLGHPGFNPGETRTFTLYQINDRQGDPSAYRMAVKSVICPGDVCCIISVTLTWDALGRYQSYALPPDTELEKGVPTGKKAPDRWTSAPFTKEDYQKLDAILKDEHSLLASQKLEGITKLQGKGEVDAITGATPASVRNAVVEGAALTCYNLWHWAHGEASAAVQELTRGQCTEAMALHFLASDRPHYALFAMEQLLAHRWFDEKAVDAATAAMASGDGDRLTAGLAYLRAALPDPDRYAARVAAVLAASTREGRVGLLDRIEDGAPPPPALFDAVAGSLPSWNGYYEIHLFLRLAERNGHDSPELNAQVAKLLDNPDFFIARRAYAFLGKQPKVAAPVTARLTAFRAKAEREGRSL